MTTRLAPAVAIAALLCATAAPGTASAATQIGETFAPGTGCSNLLTQFQTSSPGPSYAAPSPGVITSWRFMASAMPPQLKLKVARHAGGNDYTIVGESALQAPTPSVLNSFPTRIPVQAGDAIGFYNASFGQCGLLSTGGPYGVHGKFEDVPPGTTTSFFTSGFRLDVSALVEADDDNDGFGDETQDQCLSQPGEIDGCPAIQTTITAGPKDKTKQKQATFEFSSNITAASFECSLDGGTFVSCGSGQTFKVKRGKHSFAVRASAQGQTDASPASDDWKVKKKRKR